VLSKYLTTHNNIVFYALVHTFPLLPVLQVSYTAITAVHEDDRHHLLASSNILPSSGASLLFRRLPPLHPPGRSENRRLAVQPDDSHLLEANQ
jgi:hypothetical protein